MKIKLSLLVIIATVSLSFSQSLESVEASLVLENHKSILDTLVPQLLERYKVPAAGVGLISDGQIVYDHVYGEHQLGNTARNRCCPQ